MKSPKILAVLMLLVLSTALFLTGCGEEETAETTAEVYATSVEVVSPSKEDLTSYFELSGELDASDTVSISSKVGGLVTAALDKVGQQVAAGQILFTLDSSDVQDQIAEQTKALEASRAAVGTIQASLENQQLTVKNQALNVDNQKLNLDNEQLTLNNKQLGLDTEQLSLDNQELGLNNQTTNLAICQQTLDDAQLNYDRIKQLFDAGAASQSELDAAQSALNQAQLAYSQADTAYAQAKINYEKAKVAFEQVKVGYEQAKVDFEKVKVAYDQAKISYEQAQTACKQYQAQLNQTNLQIQQSELSLTHLRESLNDYVIHSPISGQIASVSLHKGERIGAQSPVMSLVGVNTMVTKVNVAESSIEQISQNMKISVRVEALDKEFSGIVTSISPTLDPTSKAYPVEITINNSGGKMKAGMVAKIQLPSGSSPNAQTLPKDAVLEKDGAYYVYVVDADNIARQKDIKVGLSSNTAIEITSGLKATDKVICSGNQLVTDGQQVNIVSSKKGE